jgi:hypothetical protein
MNDSQRTRSVADGCIEGGADDSDIVTLIGLDQTLDRLQVGEASNARKCKLDTMSIVRLCANMYRAYLLVPFLQQFFPQTLRYNVGVVVMGVGYGRPRQSQQADQSSLHTDILEKRRWQEAEKKRMRQEKLGS